jgi:hypothetical protein
MQQIPEPSNFVGTYALQKLCISFEFEFSQHSSENSVRPGPDHSFYQRLLCYAAENSAGWQHWRRSWSGGAEWRRGVVRAQPCVQGEVAGVVVLNSTPGTQRLHTHQFQKISVAIYSAHLLNEKCLVYRNPL